MHPNLFEAGGFALPMYGVMAAVGLILGLTINVRFARRSGIDPDHAWNLGVLAILSGIVGAKILFVLPAWRHYLAHPGQLFTLEMLQAGGVWYGGLIGGLGVGSWYVMRHKMPVIPIADAFAPGISLGHGLGRLGCFFAGCCYGRETDLPWAVVFTDPRANALVGTPLGISLHPTQIYEFLAEMAIFLTLVLLWKRRSFPGQIIGAYVFLYGVARFVIEFFRGDLDRGFVFGGALSTSQLISIFMVIAGGLLWLRRRPASPAVTAEAGD